MTRGLAEMMRLGVGGRRQSADVRRAGRHRRRRSPRAGRTLSRNHRLGRGAGARAGRGRRSRPTLPGTAEGAYTVDAALALADRLGVEMPIAHEVHRALFEGKSVQRCLIDLLSRESKDELGGLG